VRRPNHYCPIAAAVEALGGRWTILILYELLQGTRHFNELERGLPGISRSVLAERLRFLESEKLIVRTVEGQRRGYVLSPSGRDLRDVIIALARWGARWALTEPLPRQLDPAFLVWSMHHRIRRDRMPEGQTIVEFRFSGCNRRRVWLVWRKGEASVCLKHPGFDTDLVIDTNGSSLFEVWVNRVRLADEIRAGRITAEGPRVLVRNWAEWFDWPDLPEPETADLRRPVHWESAKEA